MVSEGACRVRRCGAAAADAFALGCGPRQPTRPSIHPSRATATTSRHEAGSRDIRVSQGSKASSCLSRLPARSPPLARILLCCLAASVPCVAFCPVPSSAPSLGIPLLVRLASSDDTQLPLWSSDRSEHVVSSQQNVSTGYLGCASRLAVVRDCGRGAPPLPTGKRLTCHKIDLCHPSYLALHLHIFPRRSSSTVLLPLLMLRSA